MADAAARTAEPSAGRRQAGGRLRYHAAWLVPVLGIAAVGLWSPAMLTQAQDQIFDLYQRLRPAPASAEAPVVIVDIDDRSIARLGQWPWPRGRIADLVRRLRTSGAAAVAFDIVFAEPDRTSPVAIAAGISDPAQRERASAALAGLPDPDALLAQALAGANIALGAILTQDLSGVAPRSPYGSAISGRDPLPALPGFRGAVWPLPALAATAAGIGALNWLPDGDQIVRRVPLLLRAGATMVPSLSLEALRVAQGASTYIVRSGEAPGLAIKVGDLTAQADAHGALRLYFARHDARRFVSAAELLEGRIPATRLQDRIVLVGSSSAGLSDMRATPVDAVVPGVEIQAQAVESILDGRRLTRPGSPWPELLAGAGLAGLLALVLPLASVWAGVGALAAALSLVAAGSWWAFLAHRLLLDPLAPGGMVLAAYFGALAMILREEQRDRRFVEGAFGRFVSPEIVARLARDPARLALGGELRPLTVMFTDIRDFSRIAERMDADALTRLLNAYLSPMSEIVLERGGTVDKYIGDAIMAFWNAPVSDAAHAEHAVAAALAMLDMLPAINARLEGQGGPDRPAIRCGIGLATGPCVVGNLGSARRFDYSAIGDDVNLASRLEGLTKTYGVALLASAATAAAAPRMAWLEVDDVVVLGRSETTRVLTALGDDRVAASPAFQHLRGRHEDMLALWRAGRFAQALAALERLQGEAPEALAPLYALYRQRCEERIAAPKDTPFSPVTRMRTK